MQSTLRTSSSLSQIKLVLVASHDEAAVCPPLSGVLQVKTKSQREISGPVMGFSMRI